MGSFFLRLTMLICLMLLAPNRGWSGEQLTAKRLIRRASAVARITVEWDPNATNQPARVSVDEWMRQLPEDQRNSIQSGTELPKKWVGQCLPDGKILQRWVTQYRNFPKATVALWQQALRKGSVTLIVYFRTSPANGTFQPTCETETLLARHWSSHPDFSKYEQNVRALLSEAKTKSQPATAAGKQPKPTTDKQSPMKQKGCSCSSSL